MEPGFFLLLQQSILSLPPLATPPLSLPPLQSPFWSPSTQTGTLRAKYYDRGDSLHRIQRCLPSAYGLKAQPAMEGPPRPTSYGLAQQGTSSASSMLTAASTGFGQLSTLLGWVSRTIIFLHPALQGERIPSVITGVQVGSDSLSELLLYLLFHFV